MFSLVVQQTKNLFVQNNKQIKNTQNMFFFIKMKFKTFNQVFFEDLQRNKKAQFLNKGCFHNQVRFKRQKEINVILDTANCQKF